MTVADQQSTPGTPVDTSILPPVADRAGSGSTRPVFVDATGRRARRARRWGIALATPAAAYLVAVAISLMGGSSLPSAMLPIPGHNTSDSPADASTSPAGGGTDESDSNEPRTSGTASEESGQSATTADESERIRSVDPADADQTDKTDSANTDNVGGMGTQETDSVTTEQHHGTSGNKPDTSDDSSTDSPLPDQAATQAEDNSNRPPLPTQANPHASGQQPQAPSSNAAPAGQVHAQAEHPGPGPKPTVATAQPR